MSTFAANQQILDELYEQWRRDPARVDRDWQIFFEGFDLGYAKPVPGLDGETAAPLPEPDQRSKPGRAEQERVEYLVSSYRSIGHTLCQLDPLGFANNHSNPALELATFQLAEEHLDQEFAVNHLPGIEGSRATLRQIIDHLRRTYCGTIGVEYMHIQNRDQRLWVRHAVERGSNQPQLTRDEKRRILLKLNQAETLEGFIHTKFLGQKRFSLEGGESMMPSLDAMIEMAPEQDIEEFIIGMAHRGRLNVLCNTLNKSYEEVFTEFEGSYDLSELQGDGDVKYHLGFDSEHVTASGKRVRLILNHNPSHLEAVNPVVLGRVRGRQRQLRDNTTRCAVVPILIHGDAAFAGQGSVMEILQLSQLEGYTVGGTVHIVLNNQIGFTTLPGEARSTRYCTDLAKMIDAPIFHVNGDDPEAVVHVSKIALRYRQTFKSDVVIDITCYRRHGHNETDEPNYTQPTMYARIAEHPRVSEVYTKQLLGRGDIGPEEAEAIATIMRNQLQDALNSIKVKPAKLTRKRFQGVWAGLTDRYSHDPVETGVGTEILDLVGRALSTWPAEFTIHPKIKRLAEERGKAVLGRGRVDWALGELLAIGSLLVEGTPCRLSGQDCRRGTFSQRHSYWWDVKTGDRYAPLGHIVPDGKQAKFCVYNSPLIEGGVLGFDYGYTLAEPNMLIIWEAQFGDFVNGAQVIIDQFIAAAESKWGMGSGLVLMLPHGQEGAGPEHSSARPERFLQLCAEDNIQVAHCTTAAQHFHILRRQVRSKVRKPLILMTPKSHLRSKQASSDLAEFTSGHFQEIIPDRSVDPAKVKRVVLCTGKVFHDLSDRRAEEKLGNVALVRIEQLYPLHEQLLAEVMKPYAGAELVWCQEEPQNQGAWTFIEPALRHLLKREIPYAGRESASSPAPGSMLLFQIEQEQLIAKALGIEARKPSKHH
ncbi:MAG: 2-oxoglutarate dehydrogenase E1 component [Planctomycetes bacterium]|nr:2-oxoglutarate dehydrogenase E1 component [Planctomycetota bacterium]